MQSGPLQITCIMSHVLMALFSLKPSESCLDSAIRIKLSSRLEWDAAICPPLAAIGRQLCEIRSPPVKGGPPNWVRAVHYVPKIRAMRSLYIIAHCFSQNLATGLQYFLGIAGCKHSSTQFGLYGWATASQPFGLSKSQPGAGSTVQKDHTDVQTNGYKWCITLHHTFTSIHSWHLTYSSTAASSQPVE